MVEAGGEADVGLAGGHTLPKNLGFPAEGLNKVGVVVVEAGVSRVEVVAPSLGVHVDPVLGRGQLRLEPLLSLLQPLHLLEPPEGVQAVDERLLILEDGEGGLVAGGSGGASADLTVGRPGLLAGIMLRLLLLLLLLTGVGR